MDAKKDALITDVMSFNIDMAPPGPQASRPQGSRLEPSKPEISRPEFGDGDERPIGGASGKTTD